MTRLSLAAVLLLGWAVHVAPAQDGPIRDEEFKLQHFVPLDYPVFARTTHVQGIVTVRVELDENGGVVTATAVSGPEALIPGSVSNAKKWSFQPNKTKRAIIIYDYRIEGMCQSPCATHFVVRPPNIATIMVGEEPAHY
jgi:hypothetical protein